MPATPEALLRKQSKRQCGVAQRATGKHKTKGQPDDPHIFGFAFILFVLSIYFVSLQLRRWRYKRIAEELGAGYESSGLFVSGEIAGSANGRKYTINTRDTRRSTRTLFSMDYCANKGLRLSLHGRFFTPFPNWKFAFAKADWAWQARAVALSFPNASVPLKENHRGEVQSLFQEIAIAGCKPLRRWRNNIEVAEMRFPSPCTAPSATR